MNCTLSAQGKEAFFQDRTKLIQLESENGKVIKIIYSIKYVHSYPCCLLHIYFQAVYKVHSDHDDGKRVTKVFKLR